MEYTGSHKGKAGKSGRTRVACRRCNSRKIKCTAASGIPCRGCVASHSDCILIKSQRGRYVRRKAQRVEDPPLNPLLSPAMISGTPNPQLSHVTTSGKPTSQIVEEVEEEREEEEDEGDTQPETTTSWTGSPADTDSGQLLQDLSQSFNSRAPRDSSAMFYLYIADQIDQDTHSSRQVTRNTVSTFYSGESFNLTYVINDVLGPFLSERRDYQRRLYFPIAEGYDPSDMDRQNLVHAQIELLKEKQVLHLLSGDALERLLAVYFRWFHPCFPLLIQPGFLEKCVRNQMSLLVLNAVLLVAVTICDTADLQLTGYATRHQAREVFYRQAKTLYDANTDPDKVNIVMAVFLMSFWWGGSNDEKDSWHWLGIAVSLAQSLGMHRSTAKTDMGTEKSKQWKRIWWCLRIRDTLTSGSIGRPKHFSERDCDVEMLQPHDIGDSVSEFENEEEKYYACQMAQLSIIFGDIISSRYSVVQSESLDQRIALEDRLDGFRRRIPQCLQYQQGVDGKTGKGLWAAMLLMAFNFGVILLCRPPYSPKNEPSPSVWGNRARSTEAANEITRVMEDILSSSAVRLCQIHTIPALFNSLSMHVFELCTSESIGRELAQNRARICMLGLNCLQESWPVSGWILKLFVEIMERLRRKFPGHGELSQTGPTRAFKSTSSNTVAETNVKPLNNATSHGQEPSPGAAMETRFPLATPIVSMDGIVPETQFPEMFPNLLFLDEIFSDINFGQTNLPSTL